jgi:simple sugar transport system permease protein
MLDAFFSLTMLETGIRFATPILLAALGGYLCQRAGVFNIGLEGTMLSGAFTAVAASFAAHSWLIGILGGVLGGVFAAAIFALFVVSLRTDEIVTGLTINILAIGMTTYLLRAVFGVQGRFASDQIVMVPSLGLPLDWIPGIGSFFSSTSVLVYLAVVAAIVIDIYMRYLPGGVRLQAVGEAPAALAASGLPIARTKWLAILASGALCGLAGTYLTIGELGQYVDNVTAGRGYIAIAAFVFGGRGVGGVVLAAFLFGLVDSLAIRTQGLGLPSNLAFTLPYIAAIIAITVVGARSRRAARA